MKTKADHNDAAIIMKLYDLRRETVMREARRFVMATDFSSSETLLALVRDLENPENAFLRQVVSYWEMAASFVQRGVLSPELFADNCGEGLVVFARLQPHLAAVREEIHPAFFSKTEGILAEHEVIREKYDQIQQVLARLGARS